jgi:fibronectin-binding autotransporter adhesin
MKTFLRNFNRIFVVFYLLLLSFKAYSTTYYSKATGDMNTVSNWNTQTDGLGTDATTFTGTHTFIIQSGHTMTMSAGWGLANNTLTVSSGGTIDLNSYTLSSNITTFTIAGTGNGGIGAIKNGSASLATCQEVVNLSAAATIMSSGTGGMSFTGNIVNGGFDLTLDGSYSITIGTGVISGNGGIIKNGSGTTALSGTNTFIGVVTLNAGTLQAGTSAQALGTGAATLTLAGGILLLQNSTALNFARNTTVTGSCQITTNRAAGGAGVTHTLGTLSIGNYTLTVLAGSNATSGTQGLTFGAVTHTAAPTYTVTNSAGATAQLSVAAVSNSTFLTTFNGDGNVIQTGVFGNGTGGITYSGTGTLTLSQANTYSGATTISSGKVNLQNATATGTTAGGVTVASGAELQLQGASVGAEALSLLGTGSSSTGALRFISGTNVWGGAITLGATGVRINADAGTNSITGGITGTGYSLTVGGAGNFSVTTTGINTSTGGTLTKDGAGTVTLSASCDYTGATTISAGAITLGASNILNDATAMDITGTFNLGGNSETVGSIAGSGTIDGVSGAPTLTCGGDNTTTIFSGVLTDAAGALILTKNGSGTLTLSGGSTNTHSGGTILNAGQLNINKATAAGSSTFTINGGVIDNTSGGTISITNVMSIAASFTFTGSNALTQGTGAITLTTTPTITCSSSTLTLGGIIGGGFGITKAGSGILALSGANTFTGVVTLNAGTLQAGTSAQALGTGAATLTLAGGTLLLKNGASLNFARNTTITGDCQITTSSTTTTAYTHTLGTLSIGNNTLTILGATSTSGTQGLTFGAVTHTGAPTYTVTNSGLGATTQLSVAAVSNSTFLTTFNGDGNVIQTGVFGNGTGGITYSGTGILTLSQANTYDGTTTVSSGTLKLGASSTLAASGPLGSTTGGTIVASGATLDMNAFSLTTSATESLTLNGTGVSSTGALLNSTSTACTWAGTIALNTASSIGTTSTNSLSCTGVISGSNLLTIVNSSTGSVILSGNNSNTGGVTLSTGTLNVGHNNALGTSGTFTIASGTTLNASAAGITINSNVSKSVGGNFTFTGTNSLDLGTGTFTLTANSLATISANTLTIGSAISGNYTIRSATGTLSVPTNTTLASWVLASASAAATSTTYTTATNLAFGAGIGNTTYPATGVSSSLWSTTTLDATDYYQYAITPGSGYDNTITHLKMGISTDAGSDFTMAIYYSTDGFGTPGTLLKSAISSITNTTNNTLYVDMSASPISLANGSTLTFRVYAYGSPNGGDFYRNMNVTVIGTQAAASCALAAGTYTVGSGQTYATIPAAITALNCGISGPVIFSLTDASYSISPQSIGAVVGASSTNTIVFKPAIGISPTITCTVTGNDQAAFTLADSDYFTFDGSNTTNGTTKDMTIVMAGAFYSRVFNIATGTTGATYNTVKNCNLTGYALTSGNYGIYMFGTGNNNNTFQNNVITKEYYGIYMTSNATGTHNTNNTIASNTIGSSTAASYVALCGIYAEYQTTCNIYSNTIQYIMSSNASNVYGIWVEGGVSINIYKNLINDIVYTGVSGYAGQGLKMSTSETTSDLDWNVYNNMIYACSGAGYAATSNDLSNPAGMIFYDPTARDSRTANSLYIYNNSIYLTPNATYGLAQNNASSNGIAFYNWGSNSSGGTGYFDVRNNLIRNSLGEKTGAGITSYSYCINDHGNDTGLAYRSIGTNDYNVLYSDASVDNMYFGFIYGGNGASGSYSSISTYRTDAAGGSAYLQNQNPNFTSTTDLHILSNSNLNGYRGTSLALVTDDYDGDSRGAIPTVGADESTICTTVFYVGSSEVYDNLDHYTTFSGATGLFQKLNIIPICGNITVNVTGNTTEDATNALTVTFGSYTMLIQPSAASIRTISMTGVSTTPMIGFNTTNNVTIDGRYSSAGNYLLFRNTNATPANTGPTIQFTNTTSGNTVQYCTIENNGSNSTLGTAIHIGTGTNVLTIDNCVISNPTGGTAGYPYNGIYSNTSTNTLTVTNNSIYNYNVFGINAASLSAGTVTGNSFYQTASYAPTANTRAIFLGAGSGHTISSNIIGGSNSSAGSTAYTLTTSAFSFVPIYVYQTSANTTSIQGNTIKNIAYATSLGTSTVAGIFTGIYVDNATNASATGTLNIGSTSGNIIGDTTASASNDIGITSSTTAGLVQAICVLSDGATTVSNNLIGDFNTTNATTIGSTLYGINASGTGAMTISSNQIGSINTASSITVGGVTTTTAVNSFYGISNTATGVVTITSNKIKNVGVYGSGASLCYGISNAGSAASSAINSNTISTFTLGTTGTNTTATITGIINTAAPLISISSNSINTMTLNNGFFSGIYDNVAASGTHTIESNTIGSESSDNISIVAVHTTASEGITIINTGTYNVNYNKIQNVTNSANAAVLFYGIRAQAASTLNMNGNTVQYLKTSNTGANAAKIYGLFTVSGTITLTAINNKFLYFTNLATSSNAKLAGFYLSGGGTNVIYNNLVKIVNTGSTQGMNIYGTYLNAGTSTAYYNNTIVLGGSENLSANAAGYSYCIYTQVNPTTFNVKNNIFINNRTTTNNRHFTISFATQIASGSADRNYGEVENATYYADINATTQYTSAAWEALASVSNEVDGSASNVTVDDDGTLTSAELIIVTAGSSGLGFTTDINGTARSAYYRGCFEGSVLIYYSKTATLNTAAQTLTNWSSNTDGTGTNPSAFTTAGVTYIIQSGHQYQVAGAWTGSATSIIQINSGGALDVNGANAANIASWLRFDAAGTGVASSGAILNSSATAASLSIPVTLTADATIVSSGTGGLTLTGNVTTAGFILTVDGSNATSLSTGVISGTGGITKTGSGTLTLSGTNTYTGVTTINAGTVSVATLGDGGVAGNLGQATNTVTNIVLGGGTLEYTGATASSDRGITLTTGTASTISVTTNTLTLSAAVGNSTNGSLTKSGAGILELTGSNTFTGGMTLSAGTLNIGHNSALGTGIFTISGGTVDAITSAKTITNAMSIGASFTFTGTQNLTQGTGAVALTASPTITCSANTFEIGGVTSGAFAITKAGVGTLQLTGTNTYSAGTTLSAGTLNIGNDAALGTGTFTISGGTVDAITSAKSITNAMIINSSFAFTGSQNLTQGTGTVTLNATPTITTNANSLTIGGVISGAFGITKAGVGTAVLTGANDYTGAITVNAGVLNIRHATATGTTAGGVTVASGAALEMQGGITVGAEALTLNNDGVSSAGSLRNVSGNNTWGGAIALSSNATRINSDAGTLTLSGAISNGAINLTMGGAGDIAANGVIGNGAGTLVKDGAGQLTLGATNTYSGTTTLTLGTILLGAAQTSLTNDIVLTAGTLNAAGFAITTSGAWTNNGATYTHGNNTVTLTGASKTIGGSTSTTFYNLTNSGATTLGVATTVSNTMTLGNHLTLSTYDLTIGASGEFAGYDNTKFVVTNSTGKVTQNSLGSGAAAGKQVFPIGYSSATTDYTPCVMDNTGTTDNISVYVSSGRLASGTSGIAKTSNCVDRSWHVSEAVVGGSTVTMTLQWDVARELTSFTRTNCYIGHYNGASWDTGITAGSATNVSGSIYEISRASISSFSPFDVEDPSALPITLIDFKAKQEGEKVRLDWETGTEENNEYFTIERSIDGKNFEKVFTKDGAGNSKTNLYYFGYDNKPYTGVSYYRLKQTDLDGKFAYSDIESVNFTETEKENTINMAVYPNPAIDNTFHIDFSAEKAETYYISMYDELGKLIHFETVEAEKGKNTLEVKLPGIASGMYVLELRSDSIGVEKRNMKL